MGTQRPTPIPFPWSSFPGANPQESSGRLINCNAEPLGDPQQQNAGAPKDGIVYRRSPGLTQFAMTSQSGYRGGLIVASLAYEIFAGTAVTVTTAGAVTTLGSVPGTKKVSIARNQNNPPDIVVVDVDNGAFRLSGVGAPAIYNGGGNLPQPSSVAFQDGYFFFTIGDGRVFASGINALTQNALTFATIQAKSDVTLLRGIPYQGYMFFFTTGHCEVWQDQALTAPNFPYSRSAVLNVGLVQQGAIAGFETGFDDLLWVGQDFGVYRMPPGTLAPIKVSPPDLDRLIEAQVRAGATVEASCYIYAGKKVWVLSSPAWTWEFYLGLGKWFERTSLQTSGAQGRWRGTGGHPAFGKWLMGDQQSGAILYIDDTNYNDVTIQQNGVTTVHAPMLMRIESGVVEDFPNRMRIARADFHWVVGTGRVARATQTTVINAAAGPGGVIRLTVLATLDMNTGDQAVVAGILGTTEANGTWTITVIDAATIDLQGSVFAHAYTSGGTVTDITVPISMVDPQVAISLSRDAGINWDNPVLRSIGQQMIGKTNRVSRKNCGLTGPMGTRWRLDISDPVYTAFLYGTQSSDPAEY